MTTKDEIRSLQVKIDGLKYEIKQLKDYKEENIRLQNSLKKSKSNIDNIKQDKEQLENNISTVFNSFKTLISRRGEENKALKSINSKEITDRMRKGNKIFEERIYEIEKKTKNILDELYTKVKQYCSSLSSGKGNNNIDVSNIALNQSEIMKQLKGGENEFDYILNKNKEMEDFGQSTPISLLKEKSFIYIVSKWVKYSIPHPQTQIYAKYSYKTGHPLFDPITLSITNFTLWIERIETKNYINKKAMVSINSSSNYVNNNKKINSKGQNLNHKKK